VYQRRKAIINKEEGTISQQFISGFMLFFMVLIMIMGQGGGEPMKFVFRCVRFSPDTKILLII
jgi:hypothetical protein